MNNFTETLKTNKKKFVFYNDWKKDYFEIDKSNQVMLENWGICDLREETEKIRIYSNGGYLEILNNGDYFITLDRSDYEYKKDDETEIALSVDAPDRFEEQIRKKIRKEINRIFQ